MKDESRIEGSEAYGNEKSHKAREEYEWQGQETKAISTKGWSFKKWKGGYIMDNNIRPFSYKVALLLIKIIPMLVAFCYGINSLLAYFDIGLDVLGYVVTFLFIILLYVLSHVFRFCAYHRMFIHYILSIDILNTIDYYIGLPLSDYGLWILYAVVTCLAMFITLYLYVKQTKHNKGIAQGGDRED